MVLIQVAVAQFWIISVSHKISCEPMPINHFSGTHLQSYFAQVASKASLNCATPASPQSTRHPDSLRKILESYRGYNPTPRESTE